MSQRQDNEVQLRLKHLETVTFSKKKSFAGTLLTTEHLLIKNLLFIPSNCVLHREGQKPGLVKKKKIFRNKDNDTEAHIKSNKYFILKVSVVVTFLSLSLPQGKQF